MLVLASTSPRRRALLEQMGFTFHVVAPEVDEQHQPGETPAAYVARLAVAKARAGLALWTGRQSGGAQANAYNPVVLGADTAVVLDNEILGKPCGQTQGTEVLLQLSGRAHEVMTAVAACNGAQWQSIVCTARVHFRRIEAWEARAYAATGEGMDKAGSYGIQGIGGIFAERVEGSYSAVVGLPVAQTEMLLRKLNVDTWSMRIHG
ncbi:MAG: Maf family protein [Pseudomonadota bacterium]